MSHTLLLTPKPVVTNPADSWDARGYAGDGEGRHLTLTGFRGRTRKGGQGCETRLSLGGEDA